MDTHERGYRSGTINTDALGFRYSHLAGKRFSVAERGGSARVNLLVGGSTALGVGASSDAHTVASCLSMLTGEVWLSLAGCGYNASQELMMFVDHQHRFGRIGHVVVLSGLNTLAREALGDPWSSGQPAQPTSLLQRLRRVLAPPRGACPALEIAPLSLPDKRLAGAADSIGRAMQQWQRLLAGSQASLTFILQPLLPWCRGTPPLGEQRMLKSLEKQPRHFDHLLAGVLDNQLHAEFFGRIKDQCEPVRCHDMNSMLSSSPVFAENLFIDRLHFNDLGNNALAKVIIARLGLVQEKRPNRRVTPIKLVRD